MTDQPMTEERLAEIERGHDGCEGYQDMVELIAEVRRLRATWRPMDSAPKDGADVLVWLPNRKRPQIAHWAPFAELWKAQGDGGYADNELGGWMPLPEGPSDD